MVVVGAFMGGTLLAARHGLRPPMRAADDNRPYTYGMYEPSDPPPASTSVLWTEKRGVAAVPIGGPVMLLSVRAEHPDLAERPVRALVRVNGETAIEATLHADAPLTRRIDVGAGPRALIEAQVERTWHDARLEHGREIGLVISWRFVLNDTESGG
jgi:hypothetical protein